MPEGSRHGGDEFLILLAELHQPGCAQTITEKQIAAISSPMALAGRTMNLTASVGTSLYAEDVETLDALLAAAN